MGPFALQFSRVARAIDEAFAGLESPLRGAGLGFGGSFYGMRRTDRGLELASYHRGHPNVFPEVSAVQQFDAVTVPAVIGSTDLFVRLSKAGRKTRAGTVLSIDVESDRDFRATLDAHDTLPGWLMDVAERLVEALGLDVGLFDAIDDVSSGSAVMPAEVLRRLESPAYSVARRPLFVLLRTPPPSLAPPPDGPFQDQTPTGYHALSWLRPARRLANA